MYYIVCYLFVSCSRPITSVREERANLSAIHGLIVIVWFLFGWGFLFIWVLGMCCVILLWHFLSLPNGFYIHSHKVLSGHLEIPKF